MTSPTSCSTSSTAIPSAVSECSSSANVSVSLSLRPDAGSSSSSRRGRVGEGAAQLAEPGQTGRKRVGPLVGNGAQADPIEDRLGVVARIRAEIVRPSASDLGRDEDVLARREAPEHLELLKRARDAEARARRAASRA